MYHLQARRRLRQDVRSVLSIDKLVTWKHLSVETTGGHVVLKASSCLRSLISADEHGHALDFQPLMVFILFSIYPHVFNISETNWVNLLFEKHIPGVPEKKV